MKLGDISVSYVRGLLNAVKALGGDPITLQQQFSLSDNKLSQPDGRISIPRYMRLGYAGIEQTGRPDLGLENGQTRKKFLFFGLTGFSCYGQPRTWRQPAKSHPTMNDSQAPNCRGQSSFYIEKWKRHRQFLLNKPLQ